jgi:hypothetical protein
MITIDDINTAVDKGLEEVARIQLYIAERSRVSGDISIHNTLHMTSIKLYAYIDALVHTPFNHDVRHNQIAEKLYTNIKTITKDLKQWD